MKVFDTHIGLSDAILLTGKNVRVAGNTQGEFPNQFDIPRAVTGKLEGFMGFMCPVRLKNGHFILPNDPLVEIDLHIKVYEKLADENILTIVKSKKDLLVPGLKVVLGIEGLYGVKNTSDLKRLGNFIKRGVRAIGPVWNIPSDIIPAGQPTPIGKDILKLLRDNNIILDLAHSESSIFSNLLELYDGPVMDSHTNCFAIKQHSRAVSDDQIRALAKRGGIIGMSAVGEFVGGNDVASFLQHVQQVIDIVGAGHCAIGSDFDGMEESDIIAGFEDVSQYPNIVKALGKNTQLNNEEVDAIMSKNVVNFLKKHLS